MNKKIFTKALLVPIIFLIAVSLYLSFKDWSSYFDFRKMQSEYKKRKVAWSILEGSISKEISHSNARTGIIIKDLGQP